MTDSPSSSAATRVGRFILAVLLSVPLQVWRFVRVAWLVTVAAWARHRERVTCRRLGARMEVVDMGDEFLRAQIAAARRGLGDESQKSQRSAHKAELNRGLMTLGKSGAAAGVAVMGAEQEYRRYHVAAEKAITATAAAARAVVFPGTAGGWAALVVGVAVLTGIIYLIVALV